MWTEKRKYWLGGIAMILLGMTFMVAATGKLLMGSTAFNLFVFPAFVPEVMAKTIYVSLPYIELAVGILLILGVAVKFAVSLSGLLIIGFAVSNILLINLGVEDCASCFGVAGSIAPSAALVFDGLLATLAVATLLCYRGSFFNKNPWILEEIKKGDFEYA